MRCTHALNRTQKTSQSPHTAMCRNGFGPHFAVYGVRKADINQVHDAALLPFCIIPSLGYSRAFLYLPKRMWAEHKQETLPWYTQGRPFARIFDVQKPNATIKSPHVSFMTEHHQQSAPEHFDTPLVGVLGRKPVNFVTVVSVLNPTFKFCRRKIRFCSNATDSIAKPASYNAIVAACGTRQLMKHKWQRRVDDPQSAATHSRCFVQLGYV